MKEGCLSFPLLYMNVKRPDFVRLRYQNEKGETNTERFIGMTARVVLHEFDHMNGVLFLEKVSRMEKDRSLRKRAILKRKVKKIAKK
jgi:peptide deformylase